MACLFATICRAELSHMNLKRLGINEVEKFDLESNRPGFGIAVDADRIWGLKAPIR